MNKRELAAQHENAVARAYDGTRSQSSGASVSDKGDVRTPHSLIECKLTGEPGAPKRTTLLTQMEKVADEAWAESRQPMVALRIFSPDSPLAGPDGWVDMTVRLLRDDVQRCNGN
jgi:hypothetical protein